MFNGRKAGVNFLQTKYKLLDNWTFIPHVRSNGTASIPYKILDIFNYGVPAVALLRVYYGRRSKLRIKGLHSVGNSMVISLKAERTLKKLKIQILNIKSQKELLTRKNVGFMKYIPRFSSGQTPIYIFDDNLSYIAGGHYKKDISIKKNLLQYKLLPSVLGLYLAEGGKIDASFTNSWPEAINLILDFVEENFNIHRDSICASICCNPLLRYKKNELEKFWSKKTGVQNFFTNLHFNKDVKSPQGIMELYFCSQVIKEIFVNLAYKLDFHNNLEFINGFLSGDGSPILQNKACITHHIVFDSKQRNHNKYKKIFKQYKFGFINKNRLVLYTNWEQNLELLMNGVYSYSPMKRFRFIKYFLSLPKTKLNKNSPKIAGLYKEFIDIKSYLADFYKSLVASNIYSKNEIDKFMDVLK